MKGQHQTDTLLPWEDCARLRQIRRAHGWTQLDLSLRLGISEATWGCGCPAFREKGAPVTIPEQPNPRPETVSHPSHYGGDVPHETYKCLAAWGLESDALLWNAAKYISRAGKKGDKAEDLRKAAWYLNLAIERAT